MDIKKILDEKEILIPKIIDILAYQAVITSQGEKYTGEKDWALNKILSLIEEDRTTLRDYIARLERESEAGAALAKEIEELAPTTDARGSLDFLIHQFRTAREGEEK